MEKTDISIWDIGRIITGITPPEFFLEIIIRAIIVYLILMGAMRLMGKRATARLNRNELAAIATLAAAVGIPLLTPDRGVLPGLIIAVIVVLVQRMVAHRSTKSQRFERLTQGALNILVKDGCLQTDEMKKARVSREQLFSQLREGKIKHLGQVKRLYIEASGSFTIVPNPEKKPGLSVIPAFDTDLRKEQVKVKEMIICGYCGREADVPSGQKCPGCGDKNREAAVQ